MKTQLDQHEIADLFRQVADAIDKGQRPPFPMLFVAKVPNPGGNPKGFTPAVMNGDDIDLMGMLAFGERCAMGELERAKVPITRGN